MNIEKRDLKKIVKILFKYFKATLYLIYNLAVEVVIVLLKQLKLLWKKICGLWVAIVDYFKNYEKLISHEKFYVVGFIMTFVVITLSIFFSPPPFKITPNKAGDLIITANNIKSSYYYIQTFISWLIAITFSAGYIIEVLGELEKEKKSKIAFNIVVSAILFIIYVFSELLINHFINDYIKIEPSVFSDGKTILKLVFIPYAWLFFALLYLFSNIIILILKGMYNFIKSFFLNMVSIIKSPQWLIDSKEEIVDEDLKSGKKFFILSIITVLFLSIISEPLSKNSRIKDLSKFLLIHSEYYPNSYCKNLKDKNILVADIGGGLYSVYNPQSKKNKKFTVSKCKVELTKHTIK